MRGNILSAQHYHRSLRGLPVTENMCREAVMDALAGEAVMTKHLRYNSKELVEYYMDV